MSDQVKKKKVLRVFGVARHLQITTNDILELLETNGWDVGRQAMQPVTEEMYEDILNKFGQALLVDQDNDRYGWAEPVGKREVPDSDTDTDNGISDEEEESTRSGYLPSETTFAPKIPRLRPIIEVKSTPTKVKPDLPAKEDQVPRAIRRKREKLGVKILIRSMDLPVEPEMPVDFTEEYKLSSLPALNLNNIDLELITQIVNMSDGEKLDLLGELID